MLLLMSLSEEYNIHMVYEYLKFLSTKSLSKF